MKKSLMVAAFLAGVAGLASSGARAAAPADAPDLSGNWALTFCWHGDGCGQAGWHIQQQGAFLMFVDTEHNAGAGFSATDIAVLHYTSGCMPNYVASTASSSAMSGVMKCSDGTAGAGTWSAVNVGSNVVQSSKSAISASGAVN